MNGFLQNLSKKRKLIGLALLFTLSATIILPFIFSIGRNDMADVNMKITLKTRKTNTGEIQNILIYQGNLISELSALLKKARPIGLGNVEKASIPEGQYIIEFFDGKEEKKYSIQNDYWIYDVHKEKFLRCSILSDLRGYLLYYLFEKGYTVDGNTVVTNNKSEEKRQAQ